jgi:hypothetical protein
MSGKVSSRRDYANLVPCRTKAQNCAYNPVPRPSCGSTVSLLHLNGQRCSGQCQHRTPEGYNTFYFVYTDISEPFDPQSRVKQFHFLIKCSKTLECWEFFSEEEGQFCLQYTIQRLYEQKNATKRFPASNRSRYTFPNRPNCSWS